MSRIDVETILKQVELLLATAEQTVETLCADQQSLTNEVERSRQELDKKKRAKTTSQQNQDDDIS